MSIQTLYQDISEELFEQFQQIRLLVCDIDGVFSDGRLYLGNDGEELKAFHTKDGFGIKAIMRAGIEVAVVTGRQSNIVHNRMTALGVQHIVQGQEDKATAMAQLQARFGIGQRQTASIGDDVPDMGLFSLSQIKIAVADAHPLLISKANYVTQVRGGYGAVREVCDLLLQANGRLSDHRGASI